MSRKPKTSSGEFVIGYMCLIDFEYELGQASDGNKIFPSIDALKAAHPCIEECGIAEVKVEGVQVIQEEKRNYAGVVK